MVDGRVGAAQAFPNKKVYAPANRLRSAMGKETVMGSLTRRSLLRSSLGLAAAGTLARPYLACVQPGLCAGHDRACLERRLHRYRGRRDEAAGCRRQGGPAKGAAAPIPHRFAAQPLAA